MTKRDFFTVLVRVFGLYIFVNTLFATITFGPQVYYIMDQPGKNIGGIAFFVGSLTLSIALFLTLVQGARGIVVRLNLDQHFDDDRIVFGNLMPRDIIKVASFVLGGLIIVNDVPWLLKNLYQAFYGELQGYTYHSEIKYDWAVNIIKIVFGFLLVTNYDWVAKRLTIKDELRDESAVANSSTSASENNTPPQ